MAYFVAAMLLLIFGYGVAQDPGCDYSQYVEASGRYNFNKKYSAGQKCRYISNCPKGYNCRADCILYMPSSTGCIADSLRFSRNGDPQLIAAEYYCGYQKVTVVSINQTLVIGLVAATNSPGGNYSCDLTAQLAPVTPALCRCGEKKTNRIVGGQETGVNEFTMMAALFYLATESIYCGATIISDRFCVTAAHCVDSFRNRPGDLVLVVGVHYINNQNSGTRHPNERFIVHEKYNRNNYDNDIALGKTISAIIFNVNVQPACLPFKYEYNDLAGSYVTFLGWGTQSFGGPTSDVLLKADVLVISQNQCAKTEPNITASHMCTYTSGKDACQYDSGGPGLLTDPQTGWLFLTAVISSGNLCGGTRPGVNTRVTHHLRWIFNNANTTFCNKL